MAKKVLITGAARRIGADCARLLHSQGCDIGIHYRHSGQEAKQFHDELNNRRANSAILFQADLLDIGSIERLAQKVIQTWQSLDVLINNASAFYPTPLGDVTEQVWDELLGSNLKAPFFLAQQFVPLLRQQHGCIVNIVDIHAERGLKKYPVYSIAKAGLVAMTKVLAKELAPEIRVNGVAPGAIIWPEHDLSTTMKTDILQRIALGRSGEPADISKAISFLIHNAPYMTGQILTVDGGRTLNC